MIHGALRDGRRRAANAPSTRFSFICSRPTAWPSRAFTTTPVQGATPSPSAKLNTITAAEKGKHTSTHKSQPVNQASNYELLELCLPPHLRSSASGFAQNDAAFVPDALKTARLALDAFSTGRGLLHYLAIEQGRWRAAVWITKLFIEHFHQPPARSNRLSHLIQEWDRAGTLDELTNNPIYMVPRSDQSPGSHIRASSSVSFRELIDDKPENLSREEILRHEILGLVWRDIGRLIIKCSTDHSIAGGEVKVDVLEMIALLHHFELMPESIYTYTPADNADAIQQPPTLHLLSSRIFTALSDAAWRARELSALEDARRKGGEAVGLEAKGSSYRVRVSGIKPEIWLELILWASLHGGWIADGASLLHSLYKFRMPDMWKPISWRDSLNAVMPSDQKDPLDWDSIRYVFDTRSNSTMDGVDIAGLRVHKTVSSEVVNAYIDALINSVSVGVGNRGIDPDFVIRRIRSLQRFLERANLNLGGGSWDAMMLRLVDSGAIDVERNPSIAQNLVNLSPSIGEELKSRRSQAIPSYVLDGNAALLGLLHRALRAEIRENNLEGALKVFQLLQERVDNDRHQSLSDFFAHKHLAATDTDETAKELFTSNFPGIEYPSFATQIPPTTLAAFLELVTSNKAFALGNWILGIDNTDIDGPLIPPSLYTDPHISASVVYFAASSNNTSLLSKVTRSGAVQAEGGVDGAQIIPKELLQAFLNVQVGLERWDAVVRILEYMRDTPRFDWSIENAAAIAKAMLLENSHAKISDRSKSTSATAEHIFVSLLAGKYDNKRLTHLKLIKQQSVNTLRVMLASVSPQLASVMRDRSSLPKFFDFELNSTAFNSVLEAVVMTKGSEAGRALVERFLQVEGPEQHTLVRRKMSHEPLDGEMDNNEADDDGNPLSGRKRGLQRMPRFMKDAAEAESKSRTSISITYSSRKGNQSFNVAMYGGFSGVNTATMHIIVRQALAERANRRNEQAFQSPNDESPSLGLFAWALSTLRRAGIDNSSILSQLSNAENGLSDDEMRSVQRRARETSEESIRRDDESSSGQN